MVLIAAKIVYFGAGTAILSIALIVAFLATNPDFKVSFGKNITCSGNQINIDQTDCIEYWNVTSYKNYSIRNKGNINIPFTQPEKVKEFKIEKKSGKNWVYINLSKTQTYSAGKTTEFRIKLLKKNPADSIKWGMQTININEDPIFIGINNSVYSYVQDCKTTLDNQVKNIMGKCIDKTSAIFINNQTKTNTTFFQYYNYSCIKGTYVDIVNTTTCTNIGVQSGANKILYSENNYNECVVSDKVYCIKESQGDYNGKYDSGEGVDTFDSSINKIGSTVTKTSLTKDVQIEKT